MIPAGNRSDCDATIEHTLVLSHDHGTGESSVGPTPNGYPIPVNEFHIFTKITEKKTSVIIDIAFRIN